MARGRVSWAFAAVTCLLFALITASQQSVQQLPLTIYPDQSQASPAYLTIDGVSGWGISQTLPRLLHVVFGVLIPFVTADLVASDLRRRTDQLLMATSMPTWAYVLGRYLAGLALGLGLALLMLVAIVTIALLPGANTGYRLASLLAVLVIWAVTVLPSTFLLSGISFGLGTLIPKSTNAIKMFVVGTWILSAVYFGLFSGAVPTSTSWDPTGAGMSYLLAVQYTGSFTSAMRALGVDDPLSIRGADVEDQLARTTAVLRQVESKMPDLAPWIIPRALYIGMGLASVALAVARFDRFRSSYS